jgi:DNA (cytosine-5)-methyltransferase 1
MPDKDNLGAVLQPTAFRWQNDRDGLQQDDAVAALRASAGTSGFHEMNHPVVAVGFNWQNGGGYGNANEGLGITVEGTGPLQRCNTPAVAHALRGEGFDASEDGTGRGTPLVPVAPSLTATNDPSRSPQSSEVTQQVAAVYANTMTVRRLTARECERLQAFPDDYTLIPWRGKPAEQCPDGPRYKALGNSMACNCMAWIGEKIAKWEAEHER